MQTADALAKMRAICSALPNTSEHAHFGETGFYVGKKLFATCGDKGGRCRIMFGVEPELADLLITSDARFTPYSRAQRGKVFGVIIHADDVTDWEQLRELVERGYRLQVTSPSTGKAKRTGRGRSAKAGTRKAKASR